MGWLPLLLTQSRRLSKGISDNGAPLWSKAIIVELKDLETTVVGEERDDWIHGSGPECVVAQVELDE